MCRKLKHAYVMIMVFFSIVVFPFSANAWTHPGISNSKEDLDRIKKMVSNGVSPWYESWNRFILDDRSDSEWSRKKWGSKGNPGPQAVLSAPTTQAHYYSLEEDSSAAYQNALEWYVTGDRKYSNESRKIIEGWSNTLKTYDRNLDITGYIVALKFAAAAEILRYNQGSGWTANDTSILSTMLKDKIFPSLNSCIVGEKGVQSGVPGDGNQGIGCMRGVMAIAVFTEDKAHYDWAVSLFKNGGVSPQNSCVAEVQTVQNGTNYGYLDGAGSPGEMGRDQAHPQDGIASYAEMAKMSELQGGDDLWAWGNNRLMTAMEYMAKYNLGNSVGSSNGGTCYHTYKGISNKDRGTFQNMYEMAYQHYVTDKGYAMPYTKKVLDLTRSESYWQDDMGWGTLLYNIDPTDPPVYDGVYEIEDPVTHLVADTQDGKTGQGTSLTFSEDRNRPSQKWFFLPVGNEYYVLYPLNGSVAYPVNSGAYPSSVGKDINLHAGLRDNSIWLLSDDSIGTKMSIRDAQVDGIKNKIFMGVRDRKVLTVDSSTKNNYHFNLRPVSESQ